MAFKTILKFPVLVVIFLLKLYQKTISPDHGWFSYKYPFGFCRYFPTCSQYMIEAINNFGLFRGFYFGCKRILRCNPCLNGGIDTISNIKK